MARKDDEYDDDYDDRDDDDDRNDDDDDDDDMTISVRGKAKERVMRALEGNTGSRSRSDDDNGRSRQSRPRNGSGSRDGGQRRQSDRQRAPRGDRKPPSNHRFFGG